MNESTPQQASEIVYSLSRLDWLGGWWGWALSIVILGVMVYLMLRLYRRDAQELMGATRWTLILLRSGIILGLVFFFFGLERRARQRVVRPSEVAVLVDTSQSMSLPQSDDAGGQTRIQAATELVSGTPLIKDLAKSHRVSLYTFDATGELGEILVSDLNADSGQPNPLTQNPTIDDGETTTPTASLWAVAAAVLLLTSFVAMALSFGLNFGGRGQAGASLLFAATILLLVGGTTLAVCWTTQTELTIGQLVGWRGELTPVANAAEDTDSAAQTKLVNIEERMAAVDWETALVAAGAESRIGDALRSTISRHDPATLAGIVLLTDGQNNGGVPPVSVASVIARGGTAIYPIGFGSARPPTNIRIVDLDAPRRVYPGDKFSLNAVLQGSGSAPMSVQVQLLDAVDTAPSGNTAEDNPNTDLGEVVDSREVIVPSDGTLIGVQFEMEPRTVGRRKLTVRVVPPAADQNPADNLRHASYEVVSRRLRALLVAGGPMREYRFLRNLLFRDESIEVDVWLQTGQPGMSQDADEILSSFPATAEELFEYDAVVAFDPDWMLLEASQLELMDHWLSQQAGGLVLISGPVYMPQWMRQRTDPRVDLVRDFYPVRLPTRGVLLSAGRVGGETSWPLKPTPDFSRADFLRIRDDGDASAKAWQEFSGVYDYAPVMEPKPGAKVYAYFSDPDAAVDGALPVYMASQFYGAGRVFFQGSGEMWRLRGVTVSDFDAYYTKLLRWVSEGRLLRDSNRGILLVDRPRAQVGDTITVRAILTDAQFQPLRVPVVDAKLLTPSGKVESVRLTPLEGEPREGTYTGRFLVRQPGEYELRVTLGNALGEEVLRQQIQVSVPTIELERPRRNDDVLRAIAANSDGRYLPLDEANRSSAGSDNLLAVLGAIEPQSQLTILPGTPDRDFQQRHNASLMWLLCSLLTMEWVVRRLNRLA